MPPEATVIPDLDKTVDIFEHLSNIPDEKPVVKEKEEKKEEEKEEEIDLEDVSDEEQEETEEETPEIKLEDDEEKEEDELELTKIPSLKQVKEKYPNLFKDFPKLEHAFFREKEYASVFPTLKDARSAKESINEYNALQEDLLNGDIAPVLMQVKNTDQKAFNKIASGVLEALNKVDPSAIIEPSRIILKTTIANLNNLAMQSLKKDPNNKRAEQLQIATELIHEALFNTAEVSGYTRAAEEDDKLAPERAAINKEKLELDNRRFSEAHGKVTGRFTDLLTKAVDKNIDPRNVLSSYVKSKVSDDVKNELDRQLMSDKRFEGIVKKLYERARSENYSQQSLDNILTALKNKAASILPDIIRAKKGEALKGSSSATRKTRELSRQKDDDEGDNDASTRNSSRMTRSERKSSDDGPKPGESAFDYLNRKLGD